jgi:hypothetical protein
MIVPDKYEAVPILIVVWGFLVIVPLLFLPTIKQMIEEKMSLSKALNFDNVLIIIIYGIYYLILLLIISQQVGHNAASFSAMVLFDGLHKYV